MAQPTNPKLIPAPLFSKPYGENQGEGVVMGGPPPPEYHSPYSASPNQPNGSHNLVRESAEMGLEKDREDRCRNTSGRMGMGGEQGENGEGDGSRNIEEEISTETDPVEGLSSSESSASKVSQRPSINLNTATQTAPTASTPSPKPPSSPPPPPPDTPTALSLRIQELERTSQTSNPSTPSTSLRDEYAKMTLSGRKKNGKARSYNNILGRIPKECFGDGWCKNRLCDHRYSRP
jgi:hypothetical protein